MSMTKPPTTPAPMVVSEEAREAANREINAFACEERIYIGKHVQLAITAATEKLTKENESLSAENARLTQSADELSSALSASYHASEKLTKENSELRYRLELAGWGPCNIPACNCPNWHKLRESADEREMYSQIQTLTARVRELEGEVERLNQLYPSTKLL